MVSLESFKKFGEVVIDQGPGHFKALGMAFKSVDYGHMSLSLPYSDHIVGNPDSGVVHGGCLTALLDTCCGFSAATVLDELCFCPTIDLRIDYMSTAKPGLAIIAEAEVIHITSRIIFTRGLAHQGDSEKPVARCSANFLRVEESVAQDMREQIEAWLRSADK